MRVLLDTHVLLWSLHQPDRLDAATHDSLEDPGDDVFFSAASIWEIAIKVRLGRVDFAHRSGDVAHYALVTGFTELPVVAAAAKRVETLPLLHRDPFDRLLLAQAMDGPFRFFTADAFLAQYTELVTLVG
jgi:PIN domain nuclease of toxin-antitoxin system